MTRTVRSKKCEEVAEPQGVGRGIARSGSGILGDWHKRGCFHRKRILAWCVGGGFNDCRLSVFVDAEYGEDGEHRDACDPASYLIAWFHGISSACCS